MVKKGYSKTGKNFQQQDLWARIGKRLRLRRIQLGLDEDAVARKLGIARATYDEFEAGVAKTPPILLSDLSRLFAVPVVWFFQQEPVYDKEDRDMEAANPEPPLVFAVATSAEREEALLARFRAMDFDAQQCLLGIARALGPGGDEEAPD